MELKSLLVMFNEAVAVEASLGFVDLWTPAIFHRHQDFLFGGPRSE